jgi:hypothetical protein
MLGVEKRANCYPVTRIKKASSIFRTIFCKKEQAMNRNRWETIKRGNHENILRASLARRSQQKNEQEMTLFSQAKLAAPDGKRESSAILRPLLRMLYFVFGAGRW